MCSLISFCFPNHFCLLEASSCKKRFCAFYFTLILVDSQNYTLPVASFQISKSDGNFSLKTFWLLVLSQQFSRLVHMEGACSNQHPEVGENQDYIPRFLINPLFNKLKMIPELKMILSLQCLLSVKWSNTT